MKKHLFFAAFFVLLICSSSLFAKEKKQSSELQQATVLSIDRKLTYSPNVCCSINATDAPLQSSYDTYEVSVRVGCSTYIVQRDSELDYFPSAFGANKTMPVRVAKHDLYFGLPDGREMRMNIVHRHTDKEAACSAAPTNHSS